MESKTLRYKERACELMQSISPRLAPFSKLGEVPGAENGSENDEQQKSDPDDKKIIHHIVPPFTFPCKEMNVTG
jgi:hypothetical protein